MVLCACEKQRLRLVAVCVCVCVCVLRLVAATGAGAPCLNALALTPPPMPGPPCVTCTCTLLAQRRPCALARNALAHTHILTRERPTARPTSSAQLRALSLTIESRRARILQVSNRMRLCRIKLALRRHGEGSPGRIHSPHAFVSVCVCVSTLASAEFRRRICPNVLMPASRSAVTSGSSTSIIRRPGVSRVESPRLPAPPLLSPSRQV